MTRLVFDIETNGLLLDATKVWCAWTYDLDKEIWAGYDPSNIPSLISALRSAKMLVGHNIVGYDLPVLRRLWGFVPSSGTKIVDTLILGRLIDYNKPISWGYSLDDYGKRLGIYKGSHSDWSRFSKEMYEYCKQDVNVNVNLYYDLLERGSWLPESAIDIEHRYAAIIAQQEVNGWTFNVEKAKELEKHLRKEYSEALDALLKDFKPVMYPTGPIRTPKRSYRRLGVTYDGPWQPVKLTEFNPGSGKHIVWWIELLFGKQDWTLTEKGNPSTKADELIKMFGDKDWAKPLVHFFEVKKLLGMLADGDKAWLKHVRADGRIHGSVMPLGTVTGRSTHSNPNLGQVPASSAYMGRECRSLFEAKDGYVLLGADAQGLELRELAHYLAAYDGGRYADLVLNGDIHTANQEAAGLDTRDKAKTMAYAYLYGAGDEKLGSIVGGGCKGGKEARNKLETNTPGLDKLQKKVKLAAKRGYVKVQGGRRLHIRSDHAALNTLLQGSGAMYMKYVLVEMVQQLDSLGFDYYVVGTIHDEVQVEIREDQAEDAKPLIESVFTQVGENIGMNIRMDGEAKIGLNWSETH